MVKYGELWQCGGILTAQWAQWDMAPHTQLDADLGG